MTPEQSKAEAKGQREAELRLLIDQLDAGFELRSLDAMDRARHHIAGQTRKMRVAEQASDKYRAAGNMKSARRQQARADECAAVIEAVGKLMHKHQNRQLSVTGGDGPTPEAVARGKTRTSTIQRLYDKGKIEHHLWLAADNIATVYEAVVRALMARGGTMGPRAGGGAIRAPLDYSTMPDSIAFNHRNVYLPWTRQMDKSAMELTMDVCVFGKTLDEARRERHMGYAPALKRLTDSLEAYASLQRHPAIDTVARESERRFLQSRASSRVQASSP